MGKEILINDVISKDYLSAEKIREQLETVFAGEEVIFKFASPGGSVYEGIELFNVIKEFCKKHNGKITFIITSIAASMASYIYLAGKCANPAIINEVEENSIFFIHNPWSFSVGDYIQMYKDAAWLEKLAILIASAYSKVSGITNDNILKLMTDETYFVGQEIIENGFADVLIDSGEGEDTESNNDKNALLAECKLKCVNAQEKTKDEYFKYYKSGENFFEKVAALLEDGKQEEIKNKKNENINEKGGSFMTKEELKAKYPDLYAALYEEGREKGRQEGIEIERERVSAHLIMGEAINSLETSAKFIRAGDPAGSSIFAEYLKKNTADGKKQDLENLKKVVSDARGADNVGNVSGDDKASGGKEAVLASLDKTIGGYKE